MEQRFSMCDLSGSGVESMSSALAGGFSTTGEASLLARFQHGYAGFCGCTRASSPCAEWGWLALRQITGSSCPRFSSCSSQGQQSWLAGSGAPRHVESSRPGTEPASPASAGGLLSPVSPGKLFYFLTCFLGVEVLCTSIVGRTKSSFPSRLLFLSPPTPPPRFLSLFLSLFLFMDIISH